MAPLLLPAERPTAEPFKAGRSVTHAANGMVATSHPLAAQVGLDVLKHGGNAIDAAIATSAAMGLMEPMSCGIGGDLYAIVWDAKTQKALRAQRQRPCSRQGDAFDFFQDKELKQIPDFRSAVVVGAGLRRWLGSTPAEVRHAGRFKELLAPSIDYAEKGVPVPEVIAGYWRSAAPSCAIPAARDIPHSRWRDGPHSAAG